jgi:hypothetical protein
MTRAEQAEHELGILLDRQAKKAAAMEAQLERTQRQVAAQTAEFNRAAAQSSVRSTEVEQVNILSSTHQARRHQGHGCAAAGIWAA